MIKAEILHPIVALAAWTMIMWLWMYITRIPAINKAPGLDVNTWVGGRRGFTRQDPMDRAQLQSPA
jgi:hypothetical protein